MRTPILPYLLLAALLALPVSCRQKTDDAAPTANDSLAARYASAQAELDALRELAELDRREMETEYEDYAEQYRVLRVQVKDTTLQRQLEEKEREAQRLLAELRSVREGNAAEIRRLREELVTVRTVLQDYVRQVDSLQRRNETLEAERDEARRQAGAANERAEELTGERNRLSQQVAVAARLNATGVSVTPVKKNGKAATRIKDVKSFDVTFTIARNSSAKTGNRTAYVRLMKQDGTVVAPAGSFQYHDKSIQYSAKRAVEYTGEDLRVALHIAADEFLTPGRYAAYIFVDGQQIGSGVVTLEK
ncbi:MAG: hypothetical protein J6M53_08835 [Bacteroidaceae bacterium]|nr:hypothetical protein [Bacteroidaceae bacterium]